MSNAHGLRASTSPDGPMRRLSGYVEHDVRMSIERVDQLLQPARMPEIVIARPREVLGVGISLAGDLERPARVVHQAEALLR